MPINVAAGVSAVNAIDAAGRIWYRTIDAFVARASDGTATVYPRSAKPGLAFDDTFVTCLPFGGGFTTLPAPTTVFAGDLQIDVLGAANAPVAICRHPIDVMKPCQTRSDRINATLSDSGHWQGSVPVGIYGFTVQRNGSWLTPDYAGGGVTSCRVTTKGPCLLKAFAR